MNNNEALPFSSPNNEPTTDDSPEESSWTFYMQDFLCNNNLDDHVNSSFPNDHQESTTLDHLAAVSDAFSSSGKKAHCDENSGAAAAAAFTSARSNGRQLSFKRRKLPNIIGASVADDDHDLEDTASSPAHSPKVSHVNLLNFHQNDKDNVDVSEGNTGCRNNTTEAVSIDDEDENNHQSELNKRGLCLVPVSMLRNYFV